jgi:glycosyltransferase involved in cell wall biosynthesis
MYLSIIAPVFNEEDNIDFFVNQIIEAFKDQDFDYELILINDCSKDSSKERIINNQKKNSQLKIINNEKNLGIYNSWKEGVKNCSGELVCLIDSDLQIHGANILKLLKVLKFIALIISGHMLNLLVFLHKIFLRCLNTSMR